MGLTTDPDSPCLKNIEESGQQSCYLVLSEEERAKGFVRPVRRTYIHVGIPGPKYDLRDLTEDERKDYDQYGYVKYEKYPESESSLLGRYWTQPQLDSIGKGCGHTTTMGQAIAETYARKPEFYGGTFCAHCGKHLRVGAEGEFVWEDGSRVGT
jgi:hypothetical protein